MDTTQLNFAEQLNKSYKLEKEIKDKIKSEIDLEEEIVRSSSVIANELMRTPKVKAVIDGRQFLLTMKTQPLLVKKMNIKTKEVVDLPEDHIILLAADINKFNLTGGKYTPYKAVAQVDKQYNLRDNVKAVVEGFIRHVSGVIKPEILE